MSPQTMMAQVQAFRRAPRATNTTWPKSRQQVAPDREPRSLQTAPKRAAHLEAALLGKAWSQDTIDAARDVLDEDFTPLTDWRATAEYRQLTAKNLLTRFFLETSGEKQELSRFSLEEA